MSRPIVVTACMLAPPNRGGLNSTHIHGTSVPVEEPSTASIAVIAAIRRTAGYGISVRIAGSFRLNAGGLDHFGPPLGIVGDELAEVGGRAGQHGTAQISEPGLDFGISQARIDLFVEIVNNLG